MARSCGLTTILPPLPPPSVDPPPTARSARSVKALTSTESRLWVSCGPSGDGERGSSREAPWMAVDSTRASQRPICGVRRWW